VAERSLALSIDAPLIGMSCSVFKFVELKYLV
jgi:hypothetical protein